MDNEVDCSFALSSPEGHNFKPIEISGNLSTGLSVDFGSGLK